jgi:PilZ domain-containing protein
MDTRFTNRVNLDLKVFVTIEDDEEQQVALVGGNKIEADVFDISVSGICLGIKHFIPKRLMVSVEIDGTPFGLDDVVKVKGEICYCNYMQSSLYKCGIRFIDMPEILLKAISNLVSMNERRRDPRIELTK